MFLENRIHQLENSTSGSRLPNYASGIPNGPPTFYRDIVVRGNEFVHQVSINNEPLVWVVLNLLVVLVCQWLEIMARKNHVSDTQLMKQLMKIALCLKRKQGIVW